MEVPTIAIRFRDIGTLDSINAHKEIISEQGYAWGGWWNKAWEYLPIHAISVLDSLTKNAAIKFLFIHSEKNVIYEMTISELCFSHEPGQKVVSPEKDKTPAFYREFGGLLLWFKITSIEGPSSSEASETFIKEYAYCDYDAIHKSSDRYDYSQNNGKIVSSVEELLAQRPRTMFFLRPKTDADTSLSEPKLRTIIESNEENFSKEFYKTDGNTLLLLSDLHFSENGNNYTFQECNLAQKSLNSLMDSIAKVLDSKIASAIIAGDLTCYGSKVGFDKAESFLNNLCVSHDIAPESLTLVPGNHDIKFSDTPTQLDQPISIEWTDAKSKKEFVTFYEKVCNVKPNEYLNCGRRLILGNQLPIEIVGLNSNCLQQTAEHFQGMGFVGLEQIQMVEEKLGWKNESYAYRILVLHHHVFPVEYIQEPKANHMYSLSLDAGLLASFVERNKIDLVIHGHKHSSSFLEVGKKSHRSKDLSKFSILSLGSASSSDLIHGKANSVALLDFNKFGFVTIKVIQINCLGENDADNPVIFTHEIPIFKSNRSFDS